MAIRSVGFVAFLFVLLFFSCKNTSRTRVEIAYDEKEKSLQKLLFGKDIDFDKVHLFLRAFKQEEVLEVWVKKASDSTFRFYANHQKDTSRPCSFLERVEGNLYAI